MRGIGAMMQGSFDDVMTFSTRLGACRYIQSLSIEPSKY